MDRILVIDDDEQFCRVLKKMLNREGYEVDTALNGTAGVLKHIQKPVALVITDLIMPEIDGVEIISIIKQEFPEIKIIAISGGEQTGAIGLQNYPDLALEFGADLFLPKSIDHKELIQSVKNLLS